MILQRIHFGVIILLLFSYRNVSKQTARQSESVNWYSLIDDKNDWLKFTSVSYNKSRVCDTTSVLEHESCFHQKYFCFEIFYTFNVLEKKDKNYEHIERF